jgi:hypothetical protein
VINIPAMPATLDLARIAEYRQSSAPYTPDGIHLYKQTNPLEIPFSFTLHFQDPFCSQGGLSLLIMAAKLHALIVPTNTAANRPVITASVLNYYATNSSDKTAGKAPVAPQGNSDAGTPAGVSADTTITLNGVAGQATTIFPPACLLDLISVGDRDGAPGVRCIGYIKEVSAKLKGPWLRGAQPYGYNGIRNVPTSGEFSFKFVHAPGFSNFFGGSVSASPFNLSGLSAFSDDIRRNLFNTLPLSQSVPNWNIGAGESPAALQTSP